MNSLRRVIKFGLFSIFCIGVLLLVRTRLNAQGTYLSETFESGIPSDWEPFTNDKYLNEDQWYSSNGKLLFDPNRGETPSGQPAHDALIMYTDGYEWDNYTVEVDASGDYIGVWFRVQYEHSTTPGQWVSGYYASTHSTTLRLHKIMTPDNCGTECGPSEYYYHFANPVLMTTATIPEYGPYHFKITAEGTAISISLNDVEYINVTDSDFKSGSIGLFTYRSSGEFDNVLVTSPDADPNPEPPYDDSLPNCNVPGGGGIDAYQGVHIFLKGSDHLGSSGASAGWSVYNSQKSKISQFNGTDTFITELPAGAYWAVLQTEVGTESTNTCSVPLNVISTSVFKGTVTITESSTYSIPGYTGALYADNNPKRAVVVSWPGDDKRFVFWHEAAYVPYWEFPDGNGATYQMFEGPRDSGELFNKYGRMDVNSYAQIVSDSSKLAVVSWKYHYMNIDSGERVGYAEEMFYFFPNGLILRQQIQEYGGSTQPMEIMIINPPKTHWWENMPVEGDVYHVTSEINIYSGAISEHFARRGTGLHDAEYWHTGSPIEDIQDGAGVLMRSYLSKHADPYIVYGNNSYVGNEIIREIGKWGLPHFSHWPIGWSDTEWGDDTTEEQIQIYPTHTSTIGMDIVGNGPYYWLIGASDDSAESLSEIGKQWLSSIFTVPCSSTDCYDEPPIDPPIDDSTIWKYKSSEFICTQLPKGQSLGVTDIPCHTMDRAIAVEQGWNVVALPQTLYPTNTRWVLNQLRTDTTSVDKISIWTDKYKFEGMTVRGNEYYGNNINVGNQTPVFMHSNDDTKFTDLPYPYSSIQPTVITWREGWNSVVLRTNHIGDGTTSKEFLSKTIDVLAGESYAHKRITKFDAQAQKWDVHIYDDGSFYGSSFQLMPDEAYFIFLKK